MLVVYLQMSLLPIRVERFCDFVFHWCLCIYHFNEFHGVYLDPFFHHTALTDIFNTGVLLLPVISCILLILHPYDEVGLAAFVETVSLSYFIIYIICICISHFNFFVFYQRIQWCQQQLVLSLVKHTHMDDHHHWKMWWRCISTVGEAAMYFGLPSVVKYAHGLFFSLFFYVLGETPLIHTITIGFARVFLGMMVSVFSYSFLS